MWLTHLLSGTILLILTSFPVSNAQCPHEDATLAPWSDVPVVDGVATVSTGVLLAASPAEELTGIVVDAGGRLVFQPDVEGGIQLDINYIHLLNGAQMHIGAEALNCRYTGDLTINFIGERDDEEINVTYGTKFLGVDDGAILEMHGENVLSWTKLDSSLLAMPAGATKYVDEVTHEDNEDGLVVYDYDPNLTTLTEANVPRRVFKFRRGNNCDQQKILDLLEEFIDYINNIPNGHFIIGLIRKTLTNDGDTRDYSVVADFMESVQGIPHNTGEFRKLGFYDSYATIFEQGANPPNYVENRSRYREKGLHQNSIATMFHNGDKLQGFSYTRFRGFGQSTAVFEVTDALYSAPILDLVHDASSWVPGDELVIASSHYDYRHFEVATVIDCGSCSIYQKRINLSTRYDHWGVVVDGVDFRVEVGLLTRNVKLVGDTSGFDLFGGHNKIMEGGLAHVEGIEYKRMGQQRPIGRYPFHWHLAGNVTGSYFRGNSINLSYARCVVLHGIQYALVEDNVCFNAIGHGFFFEDGAEKYNTVDRNLAIAIVRPPGEPMIPTDTKPTAFWITHPTNRLHNNAAAGGEGHGFWFVFPNQPMGPSTGSTVVLENEARGTAIQDFVNNVAHSHKRSGIRVSERLLPNGSLGWNNHYIPREDPFNESSAPDPVIMDGCTAYKNIEENIVISTGALELNHCSVAYSNQGLVIEKPSSSNEDLQSLNQLVILGDALDPNDPREHEDLTGLVMGEGPLEVNGVYFNQFPISSEFETSAIGFEDEMPSTFTTLHEMQNIWFGFEDGPMSKRRTVSPEGNRVFSTIADDPTWGDLMENFRDVDGSVTNADGPRTILNNLPTHLTDRCRTRDDWGDLIICDEIYGQAELGDDVTVRKVTDQGVISDPFDVPSWRNFIVPLDTPDIFFGRFADGMNFNDTLHVRGYDMKSHTFKMAFCVPIDATFKVRYSGESYMPMAATFADWLADLENTYFHDPVLGVVFVAVVDSSSGTEGRACLDHYKRRCRKLYVFKETGTALEDNDCVNAAAAAYFPLPPAKRTFEAKELPIKKVRNIVELLQELVDKGKKVKKPSMKRRLKRDLSTDVFPAEPFPDSEGFGAGPTDSPPTML